MTDAPLRFNTLAIKYNALEDSLTIEGVKFSGQLFREFAELLPEGAKFKLVKREENTDGTKRLWIERVED